MGPACCWPLLSSLLRMTPVTISMSNGRTKTFDSEEDAHRYLVKHHPRCVVHTTPKGDVSIFLDSDRFNRWRAAPTREMPWARYNLRDLNASIP